MTLSINGSVPNQLQSRNRTAHMGARALVELGSLSPKENDGRDHGYNPATAARCLL